MTLAKNLGVVGFAAAISIAAIAPKPAEAAIVRYNFAFDGNSGSFEYDDSFLTGLGFENLGTDEGLKIAFNYLGNNYTEADDIDFQSLPLGFPIVSFNNGQIQGLSYFVADQFIIGSDPSTPEVGGRNFYTISNSVDTTLAGTVTYTKVPEPFAVGGTAIAATLALWMKRKKKAAVAG